MNENHLCGNTIGKEVWRMFNTYSRPCTVSESIVRSCREVKRMSTGQVPKRSLEDLFSKIDEWTNEEKANIQGNTNKAV